MQHREEHRPLQSELVPPRAGNLTDHRPAAGFFPKPLERQRRSDPTDRDHRVVRRRTEQKRFGGKPRTRAQQSLQLSACLQFIDAPECGDHLLANLIAFAAAFHDLQINPPRRTLPAKIHGPLRGAHRFSRESLPINRNVGKTWHYILALTLTGIQQNQ
jgi:hypothetical protein